MYLKQKDIFWALDKAFVKEIMSVAETGSHRGGDLLFQEGEPADHLYILLKGSVKLSLGRTGQLVHVVNNAGEAFGWSSLIGRANYSASAECLTATKLIKLDKDTLQKVIEKDPANGMIFFKCIATILGNRLIQGYNTMSSAAAERFTDEGTGQLMGMSATELEI